MKPRAILAMLVTCAIGARTAGSAGDSDMQRKVTVVMARLPAEGPLLPALGGATEWVGSAPLTVAGLRGKIVLIDFWTYSCINWRRSLPYVRAWAEKYRKQGLVVVGVHSPEFEFEKNVGNVRRAAREMKVDYPIAIDNDFAIWRAFKNDSWPALYLADGSGHIRYRKAGEGDYEQTERLIQRLLSEAGSEGLGRDLVTVEPRGLEVGADWNDLRSPETYLGQERTERFASAGGIAEDRRHTYALPGSLGRDEWALAGEWTVGRQAAVLHRPGGRIAYRFHARDLHIVMGPTGGGARIRFRVRVDGKPPGPAHGDDVDDQGSGTVIEERLYQLIRQPKPIEDRQVEIEFLDAGVAAYSITFG